MEGNYPNPRKRCSDVSSEVEIFEKLVKAVKGRSGATGGDVSVAAIVSLFSLLFSDMKHWEIYSNFPVEVILITFSVLFITFI